MMKEVSSMDVAGALGTSAPIALESIESIELALLLQALARVYGYDFRKYNAHSILRRVTEVQTADGYSSIADLLAAVLHDAHVARQLISRITVPTTEFFRNPPFFRTFINEVVPQLREREFIRIWHAGCATGEEVYSVAILLKELGLLDRTRLYATDISRALLNVAKEGAYSRESLDAAEQAYVQAGGSVHLNDHLSAPDSTSFNEAIRSRIVFAQHDLTQEDRIHEFDVIISRNVLLHFTASLQDQVLRLFTRSLRAGGFLGLGEPESVLHSSEAARFSALRDENGQETGFYQYVGATVKAGTA